MHRGKSVEADPDLSETSPDGSRHGRVFLHVSLRRGILGRAAVTCRLTRRDLDKTSTSSHTPSYRLHTSSTKSPTPTMPIPVPTQTETRTQTISKPTLKLRGGPPAQLSEEAIESLRVNGFAVVKGAIPRDRADKYAGEMYSWIESFGLGFDRNDIKWVDWAERTDASRATPLTRRGTMDQAHRPISSQTGLMHMYGISHEQFVWDIRTEQGVVDAFAAVYDTPELIVSYDGVNVTFPGVTYDAWPHQDQDPNKPGFRCMQGIVNLLPNGPNDGGLIVCKGKLLRTRRGGAEREGTHNLSQEYHDTFANEKRRPFWTSEWYGFSEEGLQWLEQKGCEWHKVCAEPGDLISESLPSFRTPDRRRHGARAHHQSGTLEQRTTTSLPSATTSGWRRTCACSPLRKRPRKSSSESE